MKCETLCVVFGLLKKYNSGTIKSNVKPNLGNVEEKDM